MKRYEHDRDIEYVKKELGFDLPHIGGWKIAVKVWYPTKATTANGTEFDLDDAQIDKAKWQSVTGMVIGIGSLAFKDKAFMGERLCEIGDYIKFKSRDSIPVMYGPNKSGKVVIRLIDDNMVDMTIEHPSDVTLC